MNNKMAAKWEC